MAKTTVIPGARSAQALLSQRLSEVRAGERDAVVIMSRVTDETWTLDISEMSYGEVSFALLSALATFMSQIEHPES